MVVVAENNSAKFKTTSWNNQGKEKIIITANFINNIRIKTGEIRI